MDSGCSTRLALVRALHAVHCTTTLLLACAVCVRLLPTRAVQRDRIGACSVPPLSWVCCCVRCGRIRCSYNLLSSSPSSSSSSSSKIRPRDCPRLATALQRSWRRHFAQRSGDDDTRCGCKRCVRKVHRSTRPPNVFLYTVKPPAI